MTFSSRNTSKIDGSISKKKKTYSDKRPFPCSSSYFLVRVHECENPVCRFQNKNFFCQFLFFSGSTRRLTRRETHVRGHFILENEFLFFRVEWTQLLNFLTLVITSHLQFEVVLYLSCVLFEYYILNIVSLINA
jgi:hypothetical protein